MTTAAMAASAYSSEICKTSFPGITDAQIAPLDCITGPRVITVTGDPGAPNYNGDRAIDEGEWSGSVIYTLPGVGAHSDNMLGRARVLKPRFCELTDGVEPPCELP